MSAQVIEIKGSRFVVVEEETYRQLLEESGHGPALPEPDAKGNRPALETMRALMARGIIRDRKAAGLTQTELARRAGIRQETLSRIESGHQTPSDATLKKIDAALANAARRYRRAG